MQIQYKKSTLVKSGGLKEMLACYLKHNKDVCKKFEKENKIDADDSDESNSDAEEPPKKR